MGTFEEGIKTIINGKSFVKTVGENFVMLANEDGTPAGLIHPLLLAYGDDVVDMGLPSGTMWAKKNLGASAETGADSYGWYFSWGNLDAHTSNDGYSFSSTSYGDTDGSLVSGNIGLSHDAAHAHLGGRYRIPTKDEYAELFNSNYTDFINADGTVITGSDKTTTVDGTVGLYVKSKANGNRLFLPLSGYIALNIITNKSASAAYMSSTIDGGDTRKGYGLSYTATNRLNVAAEIFRYLGISIRPVVSL